MTCIVGCVDRKTKTVTIGGDSAGVSGLNIEVRKDAKVFKNGNFVIGCTTSFRMIQLLRFSLKPPAIRKKDIFEYMCTDFIDAVRECFLQGGHLKRYTDGDDMGGTFLVGYKNRLFKIDEDFQVGENINGMDALGCGSDFAIGALAALQKANLTPKEKVIASLSVSESFSGGVRKPFVVLST